MTIRNLEHLLAPASVALIGASPEPGSIGSILTRNLAGGGFAGPIWLVNPRRGSIDGVPCYPSAASLPSVPDLAVIATPPATVPPLIAELGAKGTRAAVVITAGIGPDLRQAMLNAARPYCLRIAGPNCLGLILPRLKLNASFAHRMPKEGELAFLSQSGAIVTAMIDWAADRGIGFSHVVSMGDMADADFGDFLDYLAGDTKSRAILLYMEQATSAPKFLSAARRAARVKPVVVLKSGRHEQGAKAAMSHTGALAGADRVYEAAFRRAGLLRVLELEALFEAAEMLSFTPRLEGERLAILTNGGGAGVLAVDELADFDGRLADLTPGTIATLSAVLPQTWSHANPVDIIGDAGPERYKASLRALVDDPSSDAILIMNCPTALASSELAANAVIETIGANDAGRRCRKPVLTAWLGDGAAAASRRLFAAARIPTFETPAAAIGGYMQLVRYARSQAELTRTPPSMPREMTFDRAAAAAVIARALAAKREMLTEGEAKEVLAAYGIPVAATDIVPDAEQVARAAAKVLRAHRACVVKIVSDDITHKSDVGGVRLGLASAAEAREAAAAMLVNVGRLMPAAVIKGLAVEPMIERAGAHELIVGMSVDATFGPTLLFGAGGTAVEIIDDTAQGLPPLDLKLARDMMRQTRIYRLLEGYRNRPPADLDAIAGVLVRVSYLVANHAELRELDINPLLVDHQGCIAVDARMRVADEATHPRLPLAIRPYPAQWEAETSLPLLGTVKLRPIRPEDEALYARFFAGVTGEDSRMRFFTAAPDRSHGFLARLTQIDYAREMAFVALSAQGDELLGVARLASDPDYTKAEFAVLVRSDLKGKGLGWRLMQQVVAYARAEGLVEVFGDVLAENTTMIAMCRELGFTVEHDADDATLCRVRLDLTS